MANIWRAAACLCVLLLSTGTKASNPCDPNSNYFPTATDIGAPVQKIIRLTNGSFSTAPCTWTMNCAFPEVWSSANQHNNDILTLLGSDHDVNLNGAFKVAMKAYGGDTINPTLYFVPSSPLLVAGADVSACVAAAEPAATRKLQATTSYKVINPGIWSYTIKRGSETVASQKVGNAGKLEVAGWPAEGESCALIVTTITGYSFSNQPNTFPSSFSSTKKVCWYRNNGQARANITFSQCIPDDVDTTGIQFNATVSNVTPAAQYLTQNGAAVTINSEKVLLFQPVVQVWGYYAQDLSSGSTVAAASSATARRLRQFTAGGDYLSQTPSQGYVNKYFFVPPGNATKNTFTVASGDLQEGYYRISAKASVLTLLPNLIDLQGIAVINQTDMAELKGYTEFMGWTIIKGTDEATPLIGLQRNSTLPAISAIDATTSSNTFTFAWQFVGVPSSQVCYNDKEVIPNCVSPITINAPDASNSTSSHVFSVVFTDVCGHTKNASFTYTTAGNVTILTQADYVVPTGSVSTSTTPFARRATPDAAGSIGPKSMLASAAAALMACLLAVVL